MNPTHIVKCVRLSFIDQCLLKRVQIYNGKLRNVTLPYSSLADLHRAFDKATLCQSRAEERSPEKRAQGKQQPLANFFWHPRSHGSRTSQSDNFQSLQVMFIANTNPFAAEFEAWPASDMTWPIVHSISNRIPRQSHQAPLWNDLKQNRRSRLFRASYNRCLHCGA